MKVTENEENEKKREKGIINNAKIKYCLSISGNNLSLKKKVIINPIKTAKAVINKARIMLLPKISFRGYFAFPIK